MACCGCGLPVGVLGGAAVTADGAEWGSRCVCFLFCFCFLSHCLTVGPSAVTGRC